MRQKTKSQDADLPDGRGAVALLEVPRATRDAASGDPLARGPVLPLQAREVAAHV